ncbi:MAG: metallophosphoesterase family protein [Deltaproteobacteria bacterium]|nr:metallophosphoesterase family protein [Deltaproteobacteria bacterium]
MHIGVISDTHGRLRPAALEALAGVDLIIHAGDVGAPEILKELAAIAPVTAVRGNVDRGHWANRLPRTAVVEAGGARIYVLHDAAAIDLDPQAAGFAVVVTGHTHRAAMREQDGILYFNPGSAGPRRFGLPVTVGRLTVSGGKVRGEIVALEP